MSFRVHAAVAQTIDVKVADAVVNGQAKEYVAQVELRGGSDEWQQVVLALSDFVPTKTEEEGGVPLVSWAALVVLWLLPPGDEAAFVDAGLVFTDFEWLPVAQHTATL